MRKSLKFSIIIPNFNREDKIKIAIQSVLEQTLNNWELIIVDDYSTDNSISVIEEFQKKDSRIRLIKLTSNKGAASARNVGIKASKGEYISLLDSDDYYEPKFLAETLLIIENSGDKIGFMWVGIRYHYNKKLIDFNWIPNRKENAYLTFLYNIQIGSGAGITLKRIVFEECGYFDENLPAAEDTEFFLRITQVFDYTNSTIILININKDSNDRLSKNYKRIALAYNIFIASHLAEIDKNEKLQMKFYYKMMWLNYHLEDRNRARYFYSKTPKNLRSYKIKIIRFLYEYLPLEKASYIHQKLSS